MTQKIYRAIMPFLLALLFLLIFYNQTLFVTLCQDIQMALYLLLFFLTFTIYQIRNQKIYLFWSMMNIAGFLLCILITEHNFMGYISAALLQLPIWAAILTLEQQRRSIFTEPHMKYQSMIAFICHVTVLILFLISPDLYLYFGLYFDLFYFFLMVVVVYQLNWKEMIENLKQRLQYTEEFQIKQDKVLAHQLTMARQVQSRTLPQGDEILGINLKILYEPLWQVGGDFCSIIVPGDVLSANRGQNVTNLEHCGLIFGDVMGKGPAAALIMSDIVASAQMLGFNDTTPAQVLELLNRRLCYKENISSPYLATACYLYFDVLQQTVAMSNAGHEPPLYYSNAQHDIEWIEISGLMLGVDVDLMPYQEHVIHYQKNDKLVLYTDGISQLANNEGEIFGYERLGNLIKESGHLSAQEIFNRVVSALQAHQNNKELYDDYLLIIFEF